MTTVQNNDTKIINMTTKKTSLEYLENVNQIIQVLIDKERATQTESKNIQEGEKSPWSYIKDHLITQPRKQYVYQERKYKQRGFTETYEGSKKYCICGFCGKQMEPYGTSQH
jgi:hypothetical protein